MIGVGIQYFLHFRVLFYAPKVFLQLYAHILNVTLVHFSVLQFWGQILGHIYLNLIVAAEDSQSTFSALQH